ncbi:ParM/StbA family protein [Acaryochloris marina]|uniref:ParM/StbA family protein n=1 Tax=Acaryochloris marina TaxID=155978 RepID=UPI001BAEFDF5|nr:ParM/StbA family protein [Acaryochloris marina]QUY45824.1 ParM/StbA family protein [Acaryochloris marina S15]
MDRELKICTDLGSSMGKGCYDLDGSIRWIAQDNAVEEEEVRDLDSESCVIEYKGRAWTVGSSAIYGLHETSLHQNKAEQASLRTLGMLGKVIEREQFLEGYVDLTVLLPEGERRYFKTLESNLAKGIYGSTFNGLKPNVKVRRVRVLPEGSGIASQIQDQGAMAIMFGHKDVSLLQVLNGVIQAQKSLTLSNLGMIKLISECGIHISDELILSTLICREVRNKNGFKHAFSDKEALKNARQILKDTKAKVWPLLSRKFDGFPALGTATKIYVTGGSHPVWGPELKNKFGTKLRFFKDELEEMSGALPELNAPEYTGYKNRFTDSYLLIKGVG